MAESKNNDRVRRKNPLNDWRKRKRNRQNKENFVPQTRHISGQPIMDPKKRKELSLKAWAKKEVIEAKKRSKLNSEMAVLITNFISSGHTISDLYKEYCDENGDLISFAKANDIPSRTTIMKWIKDNEDFAKLYNQALIDRADFYIDKLHELMDSVHDDEIDVKKATFIADQIKWIATKLHPKYYNKESMERSIVNIDAGDGKVDFKILLAPSSPNIKQLPNHVEGILIESTEENT